MSMRKAFKTTVCLLLCQALCLLGMDGFFHGSARAEAAGVGSYLGAWQVQVSSWLSSNEYAVDGSCAVDGNLNTAWNTNGRSGGEWIELSTKDGGAYQIAGLRIAPGYWKSERLFWRNSRPRTVNVYGDGAFIAAYVLENAMDLQTLWFPNAVTASAIRIEIADGYQGDAYGDCGMTEVELIGPGAARLNSASMDGWGPGVRAVKQLISAGGWLERGSKGMAAMGLQVLLRDGFDVLDGAVDGDFGRGTQAAVNALADRMRSGLPGCEAMRDGVVDAAWWRNLMNYMDMLYSSANSSAPEFPEEDNAADAYGGAEAWTDDAPDGTVSPGAAVSPAPTFELFEWEPAPDEGTGGDWATEAQTAYGAENALGSGASALGAGSGTAASALPDDPNVVPRVWLEVDYDAPSANGQRAGWITVRCDAAGTGDGAKNVRLGIALSDELKFLDIEAPGDIAYTPNEATQYTLNLKTMGDGAFETIAFRLQYADPEGRAHPDADIAPVMELRAESDNFYGCRYECRFDVTPRVRMLIVSDNLDGAYMAIMREDAEVVKRCYRGMRYNGQPMEIEEYILFHDSEELTFWDAMGKLEQWQTDENDITYVYLNAHGAERDGEGIPFFEAHVPVTAYSDYGVEDRIVSFQQLLNFIESYTQGYVVLLTDVCFSGYLTQYAEAMGLDRERWCIVTATSVAATAPANGQLISDIDGLYISPGIIGAFTACLVSADDTLINLWYNSWEHVTDYGSATDIVNACSFLRSLLAGRINPQQWFSQRGIKDAVAMYSTFFQRIMNGKGAFSVLDPQTYGNVDLPVRVYNPDYDDGRRKLALESETAELLPPRGPSAIGLRLTASLTHPAVDSNITRITARSDSDVLNDAANAYALELMGKVQAELSDAPRTDYMRAFAGERSYWNFDLHSAFASPGALSLHYLSAEYYENEIHYDTMLGYFMPYIRTIDRETGAAMRPLDLLDPAVPDADKRLKQLIADAYNRCPKIPVYTDMTAGRMAEEIVSPQPSEWDFNWFMDEQGLHLYFNLYDYGDQEFAWDPIEAVIPYADLRGVVQDRFIPEAAPGARVENPPGFSWIAENDARFEAGGYEIIGEPGGRILAFDGSAANVTVTACLGPAGARLDSVLFYADTLQNAIIYLPDIGAYEYRIAAEPRVAP